MYFCTKQSLVGSKNKLKRFKENETFPNVFQPTRETLVENKFSLKGQWCAEFFKNNHPLVLELGCGKGEYTVGLVAFIRAQIELIEGLFEAHEVDEIWITFPDPQIKYKRGKHRLTNPVFLNRYKHILKADGVVHLKTDSEYMHGYTLGLLQGLGHDIQYANHDIYHQEGSPEVVTGIQTFYEKTYLEQGKAITYLRFKIH